MVRLRQKQAVTRDLKSEKWMKLCGSDYQSMLESRVATEAFLVHPDPKRRCAAIDVLCYHWDRDEAFTLQCIALATKDPDTEARSLALILLGSSHRGSNDQRVVKALVSTVRDENAPVRCRKSAYAALWFLRGVPAPGPPDVFDATFIFPDNVDWTFVNTF
jgi:hypothetical protein